MSIDKEMEENPTSIVANGVIKGIRFGLTTSHEIRTASNSDSAIGHASQLTNPFLGLPVESGKCESCGTTEAGKCDGHFGFIELPIPIYHPSHISELKQLLSLLCLNCLKLKNSRSNGAGDSVLNSSLSCCEVRSKISVKEVKTLDGSCYLQLKISSRTKRRPGVWNFLERYGFSYGETPSRPLLPSEVLEILKKMPSETRNKLASKGYFPQEGYIIQFLPVPPNCLSVPDISDGISVMSSDISVTLLKKVLKQVEIIKSSRSGTPNFESQEVEANDLQTVVAQYLDARGTAKASHFERFGVNKEATDTSTKAWLEKMRTLFIRKGSGFSSRGVITGDAYQGVNEVGIPFEIAQKITFEDKVNNENMKYLQKLVDDKFCLSYKDGLSTYSLREGSKGHTFLRPGQVVHRRIMDGDIVFIDRPPTTHKHSIQALSVYVHDDHTVKINPLICGPLSADFDGDCIHLFYPQSLAAKAEVLELFLVDKQLLSSHSGSVNLQIAKDSLLSLNKIMKILFLDKASSQQLAMFVSTPLRPPSLLKANSSGPSWTAFQIMEMALPSFIDCIGEKFLIKKGELLKADLSKDGVQTFLNDIITSILSGKGPQEVLHFFDALQPMLMEFLISEGVSVGLKDFYTPPVMLHKIHDDIRDIYQLLLNLRCSYNELVALQLENQFKHIKAPFAHITLKFSALGSLIDPKSESAMNNVVQQIGFLGLQLSDRGKFYTKSVVEDMAFFFKSKCRFDVDNPSGEFGMVRSSFFNGLNPFEEIVHSISSREVIVRSQRGLSEPGTLFKNLMAILRDVVICYDGTVRNVCSNSIIMFKYGSASLYPAGEPVGVLAATAMSNPAYRAVLDSSPSSNSSWDLMKEILLSRVFRNDPIDRRVILFLNACCCGRQYCQENAAYLVMNKLKKVSLKDIAVDFMIEYKNQQPAPECFESKAGLIGHIHLNKALMSVMNVSMEEVLQKCQVNISSNRKKKKSTSILKRTVLISSECCSFQQSCGPNWSGMACLGFHLQDVSDSNLEEISRIFSELICPVLLDTIIKGDHRIHTVNIVWINPNSPVCIRNPCRTHKGELALDVTLDKATVKESGDAWRIVMDSCIPFIELIDTRRSIPYAIKQIQELLGISCAFDLAVQRLSTSVAMVSKGVCKEHFMLLASSMTSGGNLIGFNVSGYKALFRSLDIQVPITEATLFTPRKCFERAAEKRHMDSLSSAVASCSWGKHVAVGTGSRFDVLWDKKAVGVQQEGGVDVYSFLHLVRGGPGGVSATGCLGAEVDDLLSDDENVDRVQSPGLDNPTFEETLEFKFNEPEVSGWGSQATGETEKQSNWGVTNSSNLNNSYGWDEGSKNNNANSPWGWKEQSTSTPVEEVSQWDQQKASSQSNDWSKSPSTLDQSFPENKTQHQWNQQTESTQEKCQSGNWERGLNKTEADTNGLNAGHDSNWNESGRNQWGQQGEASTLRENLQTWGTPNEKVGELSQLENLHAVSSSDAGGRNQGHQTGLPFRKGHVNDSCRWGASSNAGDWKNKPRLMKTRNSGDDNSIIGMITATRQRLDTFIAEERDIISDVEPVMYSCRRIINETSDGNPLSAVDQSYVLDNVFKYHPDREAKLGSGLDYIMVSKHITFQESRCMYIVTTEGHKEDFSYWKCLQNFVKEKYPLLADAFNEKYFVRPLPAVRPSELRPGASQEENAE